MTKPKLTIDDPLIAVSEHNELWETPCPKCGAKTGEECTSLISGCCINDMHIERTK